MNDDKRFQQALRTPSETYADPGAVMKDPRLSAQQKLEVLEHWEAEAVQMQESEAEGLDGGEKSRLAEIKRAIRELKKR
jgi:hypothetical protein